MPSRGPNDSADEVEALSESKIAKGILKRVFIFHPSPHYFCKIRTKVLKSDVGKDAAILKP